MNCLLQIVGLAALAVQEPDMGFEAKIIADSISVEGVRLTTMELRYPRFIHAEFMTHRVFSRNASSSRAIPVAKMLEQVRNDPAMPIHWGKNQPGMQANEELTGESKADAIEKWKQAALYAAECAQYLMNDGAHKQVVNRILEPFQWISVIVTATEWDNFFELRDHEDAQPEIRHLAKLMRAAMIVSRPVLLKFREWHLPYISKEDREQHPLKDLVKFSAARCARVSYLNHDGSVPNPEKDLKLYKQLVESRPLHASPVEHQATPDRLRPGERWSMADWCQPTLHGNLRGWVQYRKILEDDIRYDFQ